MKKTFLILSALTVGLLAGSCTYDKIPVTPVIPVDPTVPQVSYATDIQPIWTNNCLDCHAGDNDPNLTSGSSWSAIQSYVKAGDAENSSLYQEINSGAMPDGGPKLSPTDLEKVKTWINQGAKNN